MKLGYIYFLLQPDWEIQRRKLAEELEQDGIVCQCLTDRLELTKMDFSVLESGRSMLLTDDRKAAAYAGELVCIGCDRENASFFEGAELVTDDLSVLDVQMLNEVLLHAQGCPVTAVRTERLIIREIVEHDFDRLYQISQQSKMVHAFLEASDAANYFERTRLEAYIAQVYRFYGYGLWSVLKPDGTLIGCCGLSEYEASFQYGPSFGAEISAQHETEEDGDLRKEKSGEKCRENIPEIRLELQYMLAEEFQGQGYAFEMCRAVLEYAFTRTDWDAVWIRAHRGNIQSCRLAERLGFSAAGEEQGGLCSYVIKRV